MQVSANALRAGPGLATSQIAVSSPQEGYISRSELTLRRFGRKGALTRDSRGVPSNSSSLSTKPLSRPPWVEGDWIPTSKQIGERRGKGEKGGKKKTRKIRKGVKPRLVKMRKVTTMSQVLGAAVEMQSSTDHYTLILERILLLVDISES